MPHPPRFQSYTDELIQLVSHFSTSERSFKDRQYDEASLRQDFLNPLFRALGWDVENKLRLILPHREVEIESRTMIAGRSKRADYLFRTDAHDRFVCEAKKPAESLDSRAAFQAKRYAWNKNLQFAVLTNFEVIKLYVVISRPTARDSSENGLWKTWHYSTFVANAREIWEILSRDAVANRSLVKQFEEILQNAPRRGQKLLIRPERTRALDSDFLEFLDGARASLGSDLLSGNDRSELLADNRLNDAVQHILDRLLFLRICEDRDIDTGTNLRLEVENWRSAQNISEKASTPEAPEPLHHGSRGLRATKRSLWYKLVRHFRALDRRPPSHVPFFNGNLFKPHFTEELVVSDEWLIGFLDALGGDESPYLFNVISVEILGTIYERFLGKIIRPHARGVVIVPKPALKKADGVYYTPPYIVDYIVAKAVDPLVLGRSPEWTLNLRFLDPACGSGSFLIRVFARLCEHWLTWFTTRPKRRKRQLCWTHPKTGDVHLSAYLKRKILKSSIHGVDIDPGAVEVTQLSLYLKMLEGENRNTLAQERELFASADEPLLPPLENNIKCGNSLVSSDFSFIPEELVRVNAFDWHRHYPEIISSGGFDAVVGNPPWVSLSGRFGNDVCSESEVAYMTSKYEGNPSTPNLYEYFVAQGFRLTKRHGYFAFIVPDRLGFNEQFVRLRKKLLEESQLVSLRYKVPFPEVTADTVIFVLQKHHPVQGVKVAMSEHGKPTTSRLQSDLLSSEGHVWQYFESIEVMQFVERLINTSSVIPLAQVCDTTSGFGGKSQLITTTQIHPTQIQTIKGDSIGRYEFRKSYWFEFTRQNITGRTTDRDKLGAKPKVLLRKTGSSIVATYDDSGMFPEQSLYFLYNNRTNCDLKYILALLNSRVLGAYYKAMCLTNEDSIAQVKKVHLDTLPIRLLDLDKATERELHRQIIALVEQCLSFKRQLQERKGRQAIDVLTNALSTIEHRLEEMIASLYGVNDETLLRIETHLERPAPTNSSELIGGNVYPFQPSTDLAED